MAASVMSSRPGSAAESVGSRPYSDATWMTRSGAHPMGKGQVLFTGPSGIRDYKVNVVTDDRMVGIGTMSPEGTSELQYIWRGAPGAVPPRRRSQWVGEIGWFVPPFHDYRNTMSGNQIQLKVFRKAQEEKYTHRFQEPWYPAPNDPNYKKMFPFTQGSKSAWRTQGRNETAESSIPPRPHTVASFHPGDHLPDVNNNNAVNSRPTSAHPSASGSEHSYSRPPSGHSTHGYTASQSSQYKQSSIRSLHTPPGSRPGSGNHPADVSRGSPVHSQYNRSPSARSTYSRVSAHSDHSADVSSRSMHSRGSQVSLQSRGSSTTSHGRRRITPAATSVSSAYRAPTSDPEY